LVEVDRTYSLPWEGVQEYLDVLMMVDAGPVERAWELQEVLKPVAVVLADIAALIQEVQFSDALQEALALEQQ
jgi:hypothetical protein